MDVKILEKKENKLLNRLEVKFAVSHVKGPTPSRQDVREKLVSVLKCKEDLLVIKKINTSFGKNVSIGKANVYKDKKSLEKIEPKYILKRNFPEKKAEKTEESKEEEKKVEENKGEQNGKES